MSKPVLKRVDAIDGEKEYTFLYTWNGLQVVGSILTLKNLTNIYEEPIIIDTTSYLSSIDYIPNSTLYENLKNGCKYSASVQVKYSSTTNIGLFEKSEVSNEIQFYCFKTPNLTINGLSLTGINTINTASFNCNLSYDNFNHNSNVLNQYKLEVYQDKNLSVLINSTDILYTKGDINNLSAYLGGLNDGQEYYIYVYGITTYGMYTNGNVYHINVSYSTKLNTVFTAEIKNGHIELNINEKRIDGKWLYPDLAKYNPTDSHIKNEAVVVRDNKIYFDENVEIGSINDINNFKIIIKCSNIIIDNKNSFFNLYENSEFNNKDDENLKLIATTKLSYSENLKSSSNRDVRILCVVKSKSGFIKMTYSNKINVKIMKDENGIFLINENLILELKANNGYYDISIRKEYI